MTLREFLKSKEDALWNDRHPLTLRETENAVNEFVAWLRRDPDVAAVTPAIVEEFAAQEGSRRRKQLATYLRVLLRLHDPQAFPRRNRGLTLQERDELEAAQPQSADSKPATLVEFASVYVLRRVLCEGYADTLQRRAARLQAWLGKSAIAEVLTEANVNGFLQAIGGGSPVTRNRWRQDILTLWRAAADDDLCGYPIARRIRREKFEPAPVECYAVEDVQLLLAAAERLRGGYNNGVARHRYWDACIRFAWDTGLRRGDCWRFDRSIVKPDGSFRVVQSKTRKPIRRMLRPETLAALDKIAPPQPLAWPQCDRNFSIEFDRIVQLSGVDKGTFRWLRRATGSHVEAEHPGAGHRALGNTQQVFGQSYDAQLAGEILMPPALDVTANGKGVAI